MAWLTQGLPVVSVPEQLRVSSMCYHVINNRRLNILMLFQALDTQRVFTEERLTRPLPSAAVAALACGACDLRMERLVLIAVHLR